MQGNAILPPNKYSETGIIGMVEFLIDVYQQTVGIPMGTNCAPLVADLFVYAYEADCVQHQQKSTFKKQKKNILLFHFSLYTWYFIIEWP